MKKLRIVFPLLAIFALCVLSNDVLAAAKDAVNTCLYILLPSLFPFFVLSRMFILSGGPAALGRYLGFMMRPLFGIRGSGSTAFLLGILSGYPVGAKTACDLWETGAISKDEAQNLLGFCNNSGPLFLIGAVGVGMFGSRRVGLFLYAVHVLSSITVGILTKWRIQDKPKQDTSIRPAPPAGAQAVFTAAVEESVRVILTVCGYVIFFAVIIEFLEKLPIPGVFRPLVNGVFEMTTAVRLVCQDGAFGFHQKLILVSAIAGWAGLSVHFQTRGILIKTPLSFQTYLLTKIIHSAVSAIYAAALLQFFPLTQEVFAPSAASAQAPAWTAFVLIVITQCIFVLYCLFCLDHNLRPKRRNRAL